MRNKIKLYIISGFLGSGKTTFLKRVLADFSGERLGVLVNEFGVIGVDGTTLRKDGIEYVEVNNGSIFCSCIKANFLKTLISLQKQDIDVLVIENSGLADPSSINSILTELDHLMERGYDYKGSICMVDSSIFLRYVDMLPQLTNQIISSSFVILNKTDLAGAEKIAQIRQRVNKLNPGAFVIEAVQADVPISLLGEHLKNSGFDSDSYNTPQNRTATYTIKLSKKYSKTDIETFARGLKNFALRIKGFV
ncbi:MAG: GTP-binding protein, partial [Clostridia bacterium]|nr:GTP-binding protein [Clostridia bacterium]